MNRRSAAAAKRRRHDVPAAASITDVCGMCRSYGNPSSLVLHIIFCEPLHRRMRAHLHGLGL